MQEDYYVLVAKLLDESSGECLNEIDLVYKEYANAIFKIKRNLDFMKKYKDLYPELIAVGPLDNLTVKYFYRNRVVHLSYKILTKKFEDFY